jgi:hypothetical protein
MIKPTPEVSYFMGVCPDSGLTLQVTCYHPFHRDYAVFTGYGGVDPTLENDEMLYQWRRQLARQGVKAVKDGVRRGLPATLWHREVRIDAYDPDDIADRIAYVQWVLPEQ